MTTLASLKGQLDKIQEAYGDKGKCGYHIGFVPNDKYDGQRFLTPDDALAWCYEDALKRKFPYLKVAMMVDLMFDLNTNTERGLKFYGFLAERSDLNMIVHKDVCNNMLWCMNGTGIQGRFDNPDIFAYPSKKPQYEVLNIIRELDKEWCADNHMTVEQHEDKCGYPSATRDLEDYYSIVTGVRPPNSLPISDKLTCEICRYYDLLSLRKLPEGTDVKDLRDDELIAVIKSQDGDVPES